MILLQRKLLSALYDMILLQKEFLSKLFFSLKKNITWYIKMDELEFIVDFIPANTSIVVLKKMHLLWNTHTYKIYVSNLRFIMNWNHYHLNCSISLGTIIANGCHL
jgi:hypothetical protein